jgi:hypothetical protein
MFISLPAPALLVQDLSKKYFVTTEQKENRPGTWNSLIVSVHERGEVEKKIGEYVRTYSSFFNTFCPFSRGGKDFALYSADYTCTRIMELPSCKDIGGEEPHAQGFCPTDFYVPPFRKVQSHGTTLWLAGDACFSQGATEPVDYCDFGFVAGCHWGDDNTWKIQYLDLSRAPEGIISRDERFGYIHLPSNMSLKDVIDLEHWEPKDPIIHIAHATRFDLSQKKPEQD